MVTRGWRRVHNEDRLTECGQ